MNKVSNLRPLYASSSADADANPYATRSKRHSSSYKIARPGRTPRPCFAYELQRRATNGVRSPPSIANGRICIRSASRMRVTPPAAHYASARDAVPGCRYRGDIIWRRASSASWTTPTDLGPTAASSEHPDAISTALTSWVQFCPAVSSLYATVPWCFRSSQGICGGTSKLTRALACTRPPRA